MYRDHQPPLGILIGAFYKVENNLTIEKITTTQSDPSIHFDLSHALPIYPRPEKLDQALWRGKEAEEGLGKHKDKGGDY